MRHIFWEIDLNISLYFITSLKKFCLRPSDKGKTNRNRQIDKQGYIFMSTNIQKIIERGEENVLLVFSIKFYLQMTIYIRISKLNRRYLFHMIICFNKSYLGLVRSSLILTSFFNLFLVLQNIALWRNVIKRIIILLQ